MRRKARELKKLRARAAERERARNTSGEYQKRPRHQSAKEKRALKKAP